MQLFNTGNTDYLYQLSIGTPPLIVPNDEANNAIAITPTTNCSNPVTFNTTWATVSKEQKCNNYKDVWYKFTAQNTQYLLALQNSNYMYFGIFVKNINGILQSTPDSCLYFDENNLRSSWIQNLTIGKEYWICAMNKETNDVSFCLLTPPSTPVNDEPQNAINVTVNTGYICNNKATGTANFATPSSNNVKYVCGDSNVGDVWYKFTANKKKHFVKITYANLVKDTTLNLSLVEYNTDSLKYEELTCPNNNYILYDNYIKGKEYFIKVSGNQFFTKAINFNLCITTPIFLEIPSNDECDAPVVLTVQNIGVIDSTIYTTRLSTAQSTSSICGFDKKDLWYKFVATDTIHKFAINLSPKYLTPPPYENLAFSLYQSDTCPTLNAQVCHQPNEIIGGFEIGKSYFIRLLGEDIVGFQSFYFTFTVQKVNFQIPSNDNCSGAKNIAINKTTEINTFLQETSLFARKSPSIDSICNKKIKHHDLWYKFTATQTTHYLQIYDKNGVAFLNNINSGLFADVYKGNCSSTFTALNCTSSGASFENIELKNLTIGETYYVRTYLSDNIGYNFLNYRLAVSEKINTSGDCNNAISLLSKQMYENAMSNPVKKVTWADFINLTSASQNWYKFKAQSNAILFNLTSLKKPINSNNYLSISLVKSPCADADMIVKQNITSDYLNKEQFISELEKDSTYYLVFYTAEQDDLTYQFYIEHPALPDAHVVCQNALTLPVTPNLSIANVLKDSIDNRFGNTQNRKFYKFVATSTQHFIYLKTTKKSQPFGEVSLSALFADCSVLGGTFSPSAANYYNFSNLTPGLTYHFYIENTINENKIIYDLAVLTQNTIVNNDLCSNSTSLDGATSTSVSCTNSFPIVLKDATSNEFFNKNLPYQWYHFTAKSKNHIVKIKNFKDVNNTSGQIDSRLSVQFIADNGCTSFVADKSYEFQFYEADSTEFLLNNLIVGQKYKLAMAREASIFSVTNFDMCIYSTPPPPSNDLCADAISLTVNPTLVANNLVSGTVKNALTEPFPNTSCHEFGNHTVWYKFKAIAEKQAIFFQKPANYDLYFDVFQGKCDSLQFVTCHFDSLTLLPDLKIGNEYFIAVGTQVTDTLKNLNFKIAVTTQVIFSKKINILQKPCILWR